MAQFDILFPCILLLNSHLIFLTKKKQKHIKLPWKNAPEITLDIILYCS